MLGEHDTSTWDRTEQALEVSNYLIHPKNVAEDTEYDYALLRLKYPIDFGRNENIRWEYFCLRLLTNKAIACKVIFLNHFLGQFVCQRGDLLILKTTLQLLLQDGVEEQQVSGKMHLKSV